MPNPAEKIVPVLFDGKKSWDVNVSPLLIEKYSFDFGDGTAPSLDALCLPLTVPGD